MLEGDFVAKNMPLASILVSQNTSAGSTSVELALEALERQKAALDVQIALEQNQLDAETNRLNSEQSEAELRVSSLESRIQLQKQITTSAEAAYKDVQELLKQGYIAKIESERRRQTWLAQQTQGQLKAQELAEANARLEQINIRLAQLPNESKQRLSRLQSQYSELDARYAELEGRRAYSVTSPVDGRVVSVAGTGIGRTVQAGQPLLTILPNDSVLEAELFVPSRAAGFVEEGQEVRLLYDAFPYQRFGSFPAVITRITKTILAQNETLAPFELKEPVYRVTAQIEASDIEARGQKVALQTGMTLKANIVLERRSFIDWILEPLRAVGARA
ncbi:MAG: HlyD family efflux transporter periplasmic adaptor subunit [Kordiimonas sp.]